MGTTGVQEDERGVTPKRKIRRKMAPFRIDPMRRNRVGRCVVLDGINLRSPAIAVAGARQRQQGGDEAPLRIAMRSNTVAPLVKMLPPNRRAAWEGKLIDYLA
jgi:hypothetical protein